MLREMTNKEIMSHIFIYGPPGSGKSTVGKELAKSLELPFVDLDSEIEKFAAKTIPQIMGEQGEPVFRDLETAALLNMTKQSPRVIAVGGGALLRDENHRCVEENGQVIFLEANISTLVKQLSMGENKRPLLMGDIKNNLESLLARREEHYKSFPLRVKVDNQSIEQIAWEILKLLGLFRVHGMGAAYDVVVQTKAIDLLGEILKSRSINGRIAVVSDANVAPIYGGRVLESLHGAGYSADLIVIPAGEEFKTLETVSNIWKSLLENGLDRKSIVIALGGGVVCDMAGFVASTFMRGIAWISVPTTLLSMVDASLGGKTGFDLPEGKNLIGSFHPPRLVLADPEVLSTLPEAEFRSGMAEVVKHGVISDPELYNLVSKGIDFVKQNVNDIVRKAISVKIKIIQEDPFEKGFRATLNLGHTVGHAVELVSKFQLRHGEAIAIGMVAEAKLAEHLTVAGKGLSEALAESLSALGLPIHIPRGMPHEEIICAMRLDKKKNANAIRFALPAEIGRVELVDVTDLESALED
jgi:shikimate kinase / 3-dehydroquinate synthase